jgi:hypothetical protein
MRVFLRVKQKPRTKKIQGLMLKNYEKTHTIKNNITLKVTFIYYKFKL